jgi:hypothetical protein
MSRGSLALLAGDGLGVGGGQRSVALGPPPGGGHREVLGTQVGHEVLPKRGSAIGQ